MNSSTNQLDFNLNQHLLYKITKSNILTFGILDVEIGKLNVFQSLKVYHCFFSVEIKPIDLFEIL